MSNIPMPMHAVNHPANILNISTNWLREQAHQHAANAEDHLGNGLLIPAAEEHFNAAEAYLAAVERSNDESVQSSIVCRITKYNLLYYTFAGKTHSEASL